MILYGINLADKTCFGLHHRLYSERCNDYEMAWIVDSVFKAEDCLLNFRNIISMKEGYLKERNIDSYG